MLRLIILLAILGGLAFGIGQLADQPGDISINWGSTHIETSLLTGACIAIFTLVAFSFVWSLIRFVFRIPSILTIASGARRRAKGYAAVSRGMVALGAGDHKGAHAAAKDAERHLKGEPLTLLLRAQSAQLSGDKKAAENAFSQMAEHPETRVLGLRGLHVEARRRGDHDAAHAHALEAQKITSAPWAGDAVLEHHAARENWTEALAGVERSASARLIDKPTANRQRAVLKTAIALQQEASNPSSALDLAKEAVSLSPLLVPANVLAANLFIRNGDTRRAKKLIEAIWPKAQHPDLAASYVNLRPGDKASERLARAETLLKITPDSLDARLAVAKAATESRNIDRARTVLEPVANLDGSSRPSVKVCLAMSALEEAQGSAGSRARDWLARAARAPRDEAWIADGMVSDIWQPVSPVSGKLDAFKWERPVERLAAYVVEPAPELLPDPPRIDVTPPSAAPAPKFLNKLLSGSGPDLGPRSVALPKSSSLPVIFPQANAPDDPGQVQNDRDFEAQTESPKKSRFGGLFR